MAAGRVTSLRRSTGGFRRHRRRRGLRRLRFLGTRTSPAHIHRVWLRSQPPAGLPAAPPMQTFALPASYGEVRSLVALPGVVAAATSAPSGKLVLAELPSLAPIQRVARLADGAVPRFALAASDGEVLVASVANGRSSLATVAIEPSCEHGGCLCASGSGSGSRACTRATADVTVSPVRAALSLPLAAGVVSALASDVIGGRVYAGTWGGDAEPSALVALDPLTMLPLGHGPLSLRAGFEGVLPEERGVRMLHVLPHARLLIAACAGSPSAPSPGAAVQMRMHADGSLSRLAALAAPDVTHPIAFSLLDDHSAPPAAHLYLVLSSNPPVMAHVDALTMQMLRKWELKEAGERQFGAGLVLPNGDLLMATLGERTNLHGESGATGAASAVIRLRPSHERDGKLLRMGEALLPVGDVSCAFLEPSQPDAAFFGTASSPARLMRLDTSKWPVKPLMASLELEISDGPIVSCALDSARRIAYPRPRRQARQAHRRLRRQRQPPPPPRLSARARPRRRRLGGARRRCAALRDEQALGCRSARGPLPLRRPGGHGRRADGAQAGRCERVRRLAGQAGVLGAWQLRRWPMRVPARLAGRPVRARAGRVPQRLLRAWQLRGARRVQVRRRMGRRRLLGAVVPGRLLRPRQVRVAGRVRVLRGVRWRDVRRGSVRERVLGSRQLRASGGVHMRGRVGRSRLLRAAVRGGLPRPRRLHGARLVRVLRGLERRQLRRGRLPVGLQWPRSLLEPWQLPMRQGLVR